MNRLLLIVSLFIIFNSTHAQNVADTTKNAAPVAFPKTKDKFLNTLYMRAMPICVYTGAGYIKDRFNQNIELGRTFGMIDAGIAYGRMALRPDSAGNGTEYLEAKFTMDIAQYGIFSNEMTVGAGTVFNAKNYLMLELSYTIYAQFWKRFGIGLITGYYDFSGDRTDNSRSMFGMFVRYGLIHKEGGILNNISRMNRTHGFHRR